MSRSISEHAHQIIEANAATGRLCANAETHCLTPARVVVTQDVWSTQVDVGQSRPLVMTMCEVHAARIPVGYRGKNFIVTAHETY
jgi:hypothetical protein